LFGWAAKWKRNRPDRLSRLAKAIESIGETDRKLIAQSTQVDRLRLKGAMDLYRLCSAFVGKVNEKLPEPAILLDPLSFPEGSFNDGGMNLFQINLRGRILQIEFTSTAELYEDDDFRLPYVLRGAVRSFNQDQLEQGSIEEQMIFYCPRNDAAEWYYSDGRTYRSGRVTENYLVSEMERLL
jgi:hypothetical protein